MKNKARDLRSILDRRISFTQMKKTIEAGLKDINEEVYAFFMEHKIRDYEHGGYKFMVMPGRKSESLEDIEGLTRAVAEKIGDVDEAVALVQSFVKVKEGAPFIEGRKVKGGVEAEGVKYGIRVEPGVKVGA